MGKNKDDKELDMTVQEVLMTYRLSLLKDRLDACKAEVNEWEEKNERQLERNNKLKDDLDRLIECLLENYEKAEKSWDSEEDVPKEYVLEAVRDVCRMKTEREQELKDLNDEVTQINRELEMRSRELAYVENYRDVMQYTHQTEIKVLTKEIEDMYFCYNNISADICKNLAQMKVDIVQHMEESMEKTKVTAAERAITQLDKDSRQEVLENCWLKCEVEIISKETKKIKKMLERLEENNLELLCELFECTVDDLKISRNVFMTQIEDYENLEKNGILEIDLSKLDSWIYDRFDLQSSEDQAEKSKQDGAQVTMSTKGTSTSKSFDELQGTLERPVKDPAKFEIIDEKLFRDVLDAKENYDDYLKLGPIEHKMLNVAGAQKTLHVKAEPTAEELISRKWCPEVWPVTKLMLKNLEDGEPLFKGNQKRSKQPRTATTP